MRKRGAGEDNRGTRRIIVCVDDFGLDEAVDASVLQLAQAGRISAAGGLVDGPRWQADAPRLAALRGRIGLGLHLNLTESFPGWRAPFGWNALVLRACARGLSPPALQAEAGRQLDAFLRAVGAPPDFVDGHRHVHQLPVVREALLRALRERGLRPWLRCTLPAAGVPGRFKAGVIGRLGARALQRQAAAQGFAQNRRMVGVYGFTGDAAEHERRLAAWLRCAHDGDLLMCHTALPGPLPPGDPIAAARRVEHQVLSGPGFGRLLAEQGIALVRGPA